MPTDHLVALCTCPDRDTALRIAEALVERRLAACVNVIPGVTSVYQWEGRCERGEEHLLLIKTGAALYPALEEAIRALHSYELPEVIAVPIDRGLPDYLAWIDRSVRTDE
jgi:periplasmic divalent cation tolerance protein